MKYGLWFTVLITLGLSACDNKPLNPKKISEREMAEFEIQAKSVSKALGKALKSELMNAMNEGGPEQAISVCNERAPKIAEEISKKTGFEISRVSLKNRNPQNAPNEWQAKVLEDFIKANKNGQPAQKLVYTNNSKTELRFMKAIPTGNLCLVCHGKNIEPDLYKKIKQLYPDDKAIGFAQCDIRGSFIVTKKYGNNN